MLPSLPSGGPHSAGAHPLAAELGRGRPNPFPPRPACPGAALRAPFVPTLCQQVAAAALASDPDAFAPLRAQLEARRRYTIERLRALDFNPAWPGGAFFVWLSIWERGHSGQRFAEGLLRE